MNTAPMPAVYHPILPETFTAVPNRQHSLSDIHYPSHCLCITNTALQFADHTVEATNAQLLSVSLCRYICRGPSHTWRLGICVITPKVQLSERQRVLAFGVMLLADFQMPSMTVPEAVSAQRYRQERPLMCKHNSHILAIRDFYYRLSNPLYIDAIGEITAITNVPIINAINKIIIGSIAASTLWVVISTSSS